MLKDLLDRAFQLGRVEPALELALDIDLAALLLEHIVLERRVGRDALVDGHPQAAEHDRDEAAGADAADHVEVVAGLGRGRGVDGGHELAQDHERRQAAHDAADGWRIRLSGGGGGEGQRKRGSD